MEGYVDRAKAAGEAVLASLPEKVEEAASFYEGFAAAGTADEAEQFAAALDLDSGGSNAVLDGRVGSLRARLSAQVDQFATLERWLTLLVPTVEDGNNFGVRISCHSHHASTRKVSVVLSCVVRAVYRLRYFSWG